MFLTLIHLRIHFRQWGEGDGEGDRERERETLTVLTCAPEAGCTGWTLSRRVWSLRRV